MPTGVQLPNPQDPTGAGLMPPMPQPAPLPPQAAPVAAKSPAPFADNALSPTAPQPPIAPGSTPSTSAEIPNDFNQFMKGLLTWAKPPVRLDATNRDHQAAILSHQADVEQDELTAGQKALAARQRDRAQMEMDNLKPLFAQQERMASEATARLDRAEAALPEYTPPPTMDPKETESFMFGLLAVSLVGGLAGKAGWERTTQYFNGAVQGLIDGDLLRAEQYNKQFKLSYDAAMGKYRAAQDNMKDILYATDIPINQILREAEIQAKLDGAEEKFLLAQQGHIDKLRNQARDYDRMGDALDWHYNNNVTGIDIALARLGSARGGGMTGGNNLDQYGMWALAKITAGGDKSALIAATSRWASPQRAEIWNMVAKEWYDQNRDPTEFNQAQITLHVERAAQRWSKVRFEAMGRLEESLKNLEKPLMQAVAAVNGRNPKLTNRPLNALITELGTGPEAEHLKYLKTLAYTVGREYATLATMPVSNAQMHWGAQALADQMVSGNINLADVHGFYRAVLLEVKVNRTALQNAAEASMRDVESLGSSVKPEDFGLPRREPLTGPERESRYGERPATSP